MAARRLNPLVVLGVILIAAGTQASAADSLYHVAKILVDTTAKDAVVARTSGMAQAERRAAKILFERIVPLSVQANLPEFSLEEIQDIVIGIAVRKEQTSTTRYIARLDVQFNEYAVKRLLTDYAIPVTEDRAVSISIVPLILAGDRVTEGSEEGWRKAWEGLDLSHSVTPATLGRPRPDLAVSTVLGALAGDADALASMRNAYGYGGLVIAVGEMGDGGLRVRLAGEDAVGAVRFDNSYPANAWPDAAAAAFANLETRWKTMQQSGTLPGASQDVAAPHGAGGAAVLGQAQRSRNVAALVEFSGLRDWQEIRFRLTRITGLKGLEVDLLSARGAAVTFDYAGSLDTLQAVLGLNGFVLDERNGTFVLRSR